jgi:hypothetical protein
LPNGATASAISAGGSQSLALLADGIVYAWAAGNGAGDDSVPDNDEYNRDNANYDRYLDRRVIPVGAMLELDFIWLVADTLNALMAIPNLSLKLGRSISHWLRQ